MFDYHFFEFYMYVVSGTASVTYIKYLLDLSLDRKPKLVLVPILALLGHFGIMSLLGDDVVVDRSYTYAVSFPYFACIIIVMVALMHRYGKEDSNLH